MSHTVRAARLRAPAFLIVLLVLLGASPSRAGELGPVLVVSPTRLHLGEVYWGDSGRGAIVLENAGDETLVVDQIKSTCGCTVAPLADADKRLEPGARVEVPVIMTPKGPTTPLRKVLHVLSNDRERPDWAVDVECDVKVGVEAVPGFVLFRELELGDVRESELKLVSRDGEPFSLVSVSVNSDLYRLGYERDVVALEHVVKVTTGPVARRINPSSLLTVETTHPRTPKLTLNCNTTTAPAIVTDPRHLLLGDVPAGGEREMAVKVRRPGSDEPFESLRVVPINVHDVPVRAWRDADDPLVWHVAVTAPADRVGQTVNTPVRLVTELGEDASITLLLGLRITPEAP